MVPAHEVEAQVHAGRRPGRGEDAAGVDEQDVRIDVDGGVGPGQRVGLPPVGGRGQAGGMTTVSALASTVAS
jgi:hypothetical protein